MLGLRRSLTSGAPSHLDQGGATITPYLAPQQGHGTLQHRRRCAPVSPASPGCPDTAPLPVTPPKWSMREKPPGSCIPAPPADGGMPAAPRDPPYPTTSLERPLLPGDGTRCTVGTGWHAHPPRPPSSLCSPLGCDEGGGFLIKAFKEPPQSWEVTERKRHPRLPICSPSPLLPLHPAGCW